MTAHLSASILALSRQAHALTESAYEQNGAAMGTPGWADKQRMLLADMALHLLQTALNDGPIAPEMLKRNLYSILTISAQFIPAHGLKAAADELLKS